MMRSAIIGHSGFVGGLLSRRMHFTQSYRRSDIDLISGQSFDLIVCAGMPAAKWVANREPEVDTLNTDRLINALESVRAGAFVLISTIDIYQNDEICTETTIPRPEHIYGSNRLRLERFVKTTFPVHHILRLPALFGEGLKKNALYDLIHDNQVEKISPRSAYQWYDLEWLPGHIELCRRHRLSEANLFTQPISMETIQRRLFPGSKLNENASWARYNHMTGLPELHGGNAGTSGYCASADQVLHAMEHYVRGIQE